jgi:hypothetical protein
MAMLERRWLMWWLALGCAACAGGSAGPLRTAAADLTPTSLYPLRVGYAWSYDVDAGDNQPVLATARVLRVNEGVVDVQSGQEVRHYTLVPEGIRRDQGSFLLRAPIVAGSHWRSGPDSEAHVIALGQTVETQSGAFRACVVIDEKHPGSGQQVTTTYCPGVGPVRIESQMEVRGRVVRVRAVLRGFTGEAP